MPANCASSVFLYLACLKRFSILVNISVGTLCSLLQNGLLESWHTKEPPRVLISGNASSIGYYVVDYEDMSLKMSSPATRAAEQFLHAATMGNMLGHKKEKVEFSVGPQLHETLQAPSRREVV